VLYLITNVAEHRYCKNCKRPGGHKFISQQCDPILIRREDKKMFWNGTLIPVPWPFSLFFKKANWIVQGRSL
jgi:hypothetical protein